MTDLEFVPILALGLVVYTLTNLVKYARARDWNGVLTLLAGWAIGVLAVWLVGATDWGATITVGGTKTLDLLGWAEKILVGLVVVSAASTVADLRKSFDNSDTATKPHLVDSAASHPSAPAQP
jgi:hypothetical protein